MNTVKYYKIVPADKESKYFDFLYLDSDRNKVSSLTNVPESKKSLHENKCICSGYIKLPNDCAITYKLIGEDTSGSTIISENDNLEPLIEMAKSQDIYEKWSIIDNSSGEIVKEGTNTKKTKKDKKSKLKWW